MSDRDEARDEAREEELEESDLDGRSADEKTAEAKPEAEGAEEEDEEALYFFPEGGVTESELKVVLASDDVERRAWAISHLLRYAQWDDIWGYIDRDTVREIFPHLDLPENLRSAWARMLKIETPVG